MESDGSLQCMHTDADTNAAGQFGVRWQPAVHACTRMQTLACGTMWSKMAACRASPHLFPLRQVSFEMGSLVYYCISQALHFLGIPPLCLTSPCRPYNVGSLKLQIQFTTCGCRWVLRVQAQVLRRCSKHCTHRVTSQLCCIETELCNSSGLWRGTREMQNKGQQENTRGVEDFEHHEGGAPDLQLLWSGG